MQNQYRSYNSINRMHIFFWLLIINNSLIFYLDIHSVYLFFPTSFNPFLVNVSFFTPWKKLENIWFSGVFRGKKIGTLATNGLKSECHCISGNTPNITKSSSNLDYGTTFQKEVTNIYELINTIFFKIFNIFNKTGKLFSARIFHERLWWYQFFLILYPKQTQNCKNHLLPSLKACVHSIFY